MTLEGLLLTKGIPGPSQTLPKRHTHTHTPFYRPGHLAHRLAISLKAPPAFVDGGEGSVAMFGSNIDVDKAL